MSYQSTTTATPTNTPTPTTSIPSTDTLRLILTHLTESSLHETCRTLRLESQIGMVGLFSTSKGRLIQCCEGGMWGEVLEVLEGLDLGRVRESYLEDYFRGSGNVVRNDSGDNNNGDDRNELASKMVIPLEKAVAMAHEMTILELADRGEIELAYATLRLCSEMLDKSLPVHGDGSEDMEDVMDGNHEQHEAGEGQRSASESLGLISSRSGDVERRINALISLRASASGASGANGTNGTNGVNLANSGAMDLLPQNYYGPSNIPKQKRRSQIAKLFKRHVPEVPNQRLSCLLGQSLKWQCFTGVFPTVKRMFREDGEGGTVEDGVGQLEEGEDHKKKKKRKRDTNTDISTDQRFDLILGNVDLLPIDAKRKKKKDGGGGGALERIASKPDQTIRMGKRSYIECALFLPDGRGLVTGSSDGFVEIWGEPMNDSNGSNAKNENNPTSSTENETSEKSTSLKSLDSLLPKEMDYEKLRTTDLPYQKNDDLILHESAILAMDVSNDGKMLATASSDGMLCVWKIGDGKLLRRIERAHGGLDVGGKGSGGEKGAAVTCIQFAPDASKLLTGGHDCTCREFGLLTSRMLKEFRGHKSYVHNCSYVILPPSSVGMPSNTGGGDDGNFLAVVTSSADGTIRVWNGRTAESLREITPPLSTSPTSTTIDTTHNVANAEIHMGKPIHTTLHLHSPPNTMIVVPRSDRAFLMTYTGTVLRTYCREDVQGKEFVTGIISPSNQWLYVVGEDGKCVVFDVGTGRVEKMIRGFDEDCSGSVSGGGDDDVACEVTGLVHHPHRSFVGGYSNDKKQKRGILTLWK